MSFQVIILIIYAFLVVSYVVFLIQQAIAYKAKYGYLCEASGLGELKNEKYKIYHAGYFLFGFLGLFMVYNLSLILDSSVWTKISFISIYIMEIAVCLIALSPRDTKPKAHTILSLILFISAVIALIALIVPFYVSDVIPNFVIILNILIIMFLILYLFLKIRLAILFGRDNNFEAKISLLEWIPFLLTFVLTFILLISLIIHFL